MKSLVDALEAEAAKTKSSAKAKSAASDQNEADGDVAATKKSPPKSARRRSREFALQALYQWQVAAHSPGDLETQFSEADGFKRSDAILFSALMRGTIKESSSLIEQLTPHLDRTWTEVSPIERGILLLSSFELLHMAETPYRVIINEAIELAKSFGGTDGHKYVNGILDKLAATVRADEITHQVASGVAVKKRAVATPTVTVKARRVSKPE
jgi:transcription antitermination protein NusB